YFLGNRKELVFELESEMKELSAKRQFELAIQKRDAIFSIQGHGQKQVIEKFTKKNADYIAFAKLGGSFSMQLFEFRKGTLLSKKSFNFNSEIVEKDILEDFLQNYYSENKAPDEIVLQEMPKNFKEIEQTISSISGRQIRIIVPKAGKKKKILGLVQKNLSFALNPQNDPLIGLKNTLLLSSVPRVIECFDVSHLGGTNTTASMVSFLDGKPNKSQYRRFGIKTVEWIDDFAAMQEVVGRRYRRLKEEGQKMPDLILVDGGKGQLSAAQKVLEELGQKIPIVGLAKKNEELFHPMRKTPIVLDKKDAGLKILTHIRNEAHRFALKYQKKLREKEFKQF
ncbi:MAG: excinuclease ABC subunit C, partial [Candidatus Diapherotrites archaeon]|nr:excinuclease ABC subunit C [Candidatus Diapherotrites archaeon]